MESGKQINFLNVSCQNINPLNGFYSKGGCFRTENILVREIINMNIINVTSTNTSAGFKAIDDKKDLSDLKNKFDFMGRSHVFYFYCEFKKFISFID